MTDEMVSMQVIVMFRSRFSEAFSSKLAHLGPRDVERGVDDGPPSPQIESFLCAMLGLVNNRKKPVEYADTVAWMGLWEVKSLTLVADEDITGVHWKMPSRRRRTLGRAVGRERAHWPKARLLGP